MDSTPLAKSPLYEWLRERPMLRGFSVIRCADELAAQILNVAIGWYIYGATHKPMSLAYVGLAQFLPNVAMLLIAGQVADRFDRRKVIGLSLLTQSLCLAAFSIWVIATVPSTKPLYLVLFLMSSARAFASPAISAMLPQTVASEEFPRAVAATSSAFQICAIVGPAIGGLLYAVGFQTVLALTTGLYFLALAHIRGLPKGRAANSDLENNLKDKTVLAGIRYIRANRLLLSLISLDLFAVLLGGVTALLPIYAKDILAVGPVGLGILRCAPGVGAGVVGLVLAHRTMERSAGKRMLACVAGFGLATIVFALSRDFWLSVTALLVAGGFDMVSMVIRETLLQIATPDAMRGRVSAVNWIFIGASSELGQFESGAMAALIGTVPAAALGGFGTLVVVAIWTTRFPELRRANDLVTVGASGPDRR